MADEAQVELNEDQVDRKDTLRDAFDALEAPTNDSAEPQSTRARDESGKFVKAADLKTQAKAPVDEKVLSAAPQTTNEQPPDAPWKRPPVSWKKEMHEHWLTAADPLKQYAFQREEEMRAGVQPLKEKAQLADSILKIAEPHQQTMRGLGVDLPTVIQAFFNADHTLRSGNQQQKLGLLVKLAQNYGVDLSPLTGQQIAAPNGDYHALANQLNQFRGEVMGWRQQQEEAENQALLSDIHSFAQSHEHFETVKPAMIALLQSGQAEDLESAYKKAIRLNDELFESEVQARQAASVRAKDEKAKAARAAAVSVRGSTPGSNTAPKAQGRRAMLEEAFSGVESRV